MDNILNNDNRTSDVIELKTPTQSDIASDMLKYHNPHRNIINVTNEKK